MSVKLVNSVALLTDSNSVIGVGQDRASVAFFLRINGPLPLAYSGWAGTILAQRGPSTGKGFSASVFTLDATAQTVTLRMYWRVTDATAASANIVLSPGIVYPIAMTYDKDAPDSQAVYVAGVKYPMGPTKSLPLDSTATNFQLGTVFGGSILRDLSYEKWMWWNGYVLTPDEVLDIADGVGDPTNIGLSASWRGYWKLDGPSGTTPINGDAALANSVGDNAFPLATFVNGSVAGSSLSYGDAMPFVSQVHYESPVVCSSGKSFRVRTTGPDGADLVVASFGSADPTIKINGGAPITPAVHFSETHYGAIYFLPPGSSVAPGDSVTFSADSGFLVTGLGETPGAIDMACVNKSGSAIYGDQARTLIGGLNYTYPGSSYWSYYQGPSNWAWRMLVDRVNESTSTVRDDGTLKVNRSAILLVSTATADQIDDLSYPMPLGKWLVSFVPNDAGRATDVTLTSGTPGCCNEITAYGNDGSSAGDRVLKVYDVAEHYDTANTLGADVDATTTTIQLANTANITGRSVFSGRPVVWLKVDDEYMTIETVNSSTNVVTVTRGVLGSTAAAHTSGTVCFSRYYVQNPSLYVNVSGPGGAPDYSDLVIYGPDDWTPPGTVRQLTDSDVDTSLAAQLRPSKFVRDSMVHTGIVRHMDSTMGNTRQIAEPEYMRETSDKYCTYDAKFVQDLRITDLKPFDPVATPCFYVHHPTWPGAETYSATLASAIDAVQTTITISDAATAKVVEGSRLFIDSEQLRVTALDGTTATVARGCMGTTAASHAAGAITVGWRVPITSTSQYQLANKAAIALTTDRPHRLRSGMFSADPTKTDMNPLARGAVTLAADATPVTSGAQTITLAASDWTYIKPGMYVQIAGGELVRLTAVDPGTGVCTLKSNLGSSYPSGTAGSTMACGAWCKSLDGTVHAWTPKQGAFCTFYVTGPSTLLVLYNVDLGGAIGVVDGDQTWDQTAAGSGAADQSMLHWKTPIQVYPYEYPPLVAAESPGSILWVNVPIMASDDVAYDIAVRTRDNLPSGAGHKVVVELGNEIWNGAFPPITIYQNMVPLIGAANWLDTWILRTKAVVQIVKDAFAATGHDAEVLLSLPYQAGNINAPLARARAVAVDVDVVSTAPYFGPAYTATAGSTINAIDDDQAIDWWLFDYECTTVTSMGQIIRDVDQPSRLTHESLTGRPLKFYTYEGGFASMLPVPANGTNDTSVYANGVERNLDLSYNPTCYPASLDRLSVDQRNGVDGYTFFTHCQPPGPLARGAGMYHEMWGLTAYHGQPAGRGDGSDGKADNRLTLAQPGKTHTKGPLVNLHGTNVSVRLQALLDWNAARASGPDVPFPTWIRRRVGRGLHRASTW